MALGEVGADAHALLTHHPDHVPAGRVELSWGPEDRAEQGGCALDGLDVIVDSRLGPAPKERREHRHPDEPSVICAAPTVASLGSLVASKRLFSTAGIQPFGVVTGDESQLLVALVARMRLQRGGQAMGVGNRLLRGQDRVAGGDRPDVRQVAQHPHPVGTTHAPPWSTTSQRRKGVFSLASLPEKGVRVSWRAGSSPRRSRARSR